MGCVDKGVRAPPHQEACRLWYCWSMCLGVGPNQAVGLLCVCMCVCVCVCIFVCVSMCVCVCVFKQKQVNCTTHNMLHTMLNKAICWPSH